MPKEQLITNGKTLFAFCYPNIEKVRKYEKFLLCHSRWRFEDRDKHDRPFFCLSFPEKFLHFSSPWAVKIEKSFSISIAIRQENMARGVKWIILAVVVINNMKLLCCGVINHTHGSHVDKIYVFISLSFSRSRRDFLSFDATILKIAIPFVNDSPTVLGD